MSHSNNFSGIIGPIMNYRLMHLSIKTPEEQQLYNAYVAQQNKIRKSFNKKYIQLQKIQHNVTLRTLLSTATSTRNTQNRNKILKQYFNIINNGKTPKKPNNPNNSNNSNNPKTPKKSKNHNNSNNPPSAKRRKVVTP